MKCEHVMIYYSKGKPVAYNFLFAGDQRPEAPPGIRAAVTSFARAYARFPSVRANWNADGTPIERSVDARRTDSSRLHAMAR